MTISKLPGIHQNKDAEIKSIPARSINDLFQLIPTSDDASERVCCADPEEVGTPVFLAEEVDVLVSIATVPVATQ